jgi:hypothetical protein
VSVATVIVRSLRERKVASNVYAIDLSAAVVEKGDDDLLEEPSDETLPVAEEVSVAMVIVKSLRRRKVSSDAYVIDLSAAVVEKVDDAREGGQPSGDAWHGCATVQVHGEADR